MQTPIINAQLRLPPISALLSKADPDFADWMPSSAPFVQSGSVLASGFHNAVMTESDIMSTESLGQALSMDLMELMRSAVPAEKLGLLQAAQASNASDTVIRFLLQELKREQLKNQALHAHLMMQSTVTKPSVLQGHFDNRIERAQEDLADKTNLGVKRSRKEDDIDQLLLTARKRRVHVKSACASCKASHIACDEGQPCRNCVRRGCRCVRGQEPSSSKAVDDGKACQNESDAAQRQSPTSPNSEDESDKSTASTASASVPQSPDRAL